MSEVHPQGRAQPVTLPPPRYAAQLLQAMDSVPETQGLGMTILTDRGVSVVRPCPAGG